MEFIYTPQGVCSRQFIFNIIDDKVDSLKIIGGCHGNTQGISVLVKGMKIDDVIEKLEGIDCQFRGTSCPDQIAKALIEYKETNKNKENYE